MVTEESLRQPLAPVIFGAAGDIGRTVFQQLILDRGIVPAGIVLRENRLADKASRYQTAGQIAQNYHADGTHNVFEEVRLTEQEITVNGIVIPVFSPATQDEILQAGHPVIETTGRHKHAAAFEPLLSAGADFVVVTGPMKDDTEKIVAGVNGSQERYKKAKAAGIVSTSSCTTTGVSSFLGPALTSPIKNGSSLQPSGAFINVLHARTKSNTETEIRDNIKLSPSGATTEIPKVLGIDHTQLALELDCARANANCGSLASMALLFGPDAHENNAENLKMRIRAALIAGTSSYEFDDAIDTTRSVIGRKASIVLNLSQMRIRNLPNNGGTLASGIQGYYDNVRGYTRSVLDSYLAMSML